MEDAQERDLVEFATEDGDLVTLEVIDYFFYNGQEYALLMDYDPEAEKEDGCGEEGHTCECCECGCDEDDDDQDGMYIMKVVTTGDQEEFIPLSEEEMAPIIEFLDNCPDEDDEDDKDDDNA